MRDFINSFLTALGLVLAIPTSLILISWNALPGDSLYGLKTGLENVAFTLTKDTPIATAFSIKFTDRRFNEANILLSEKGSTLGYTLLVAEAKKTSDVIVQKNDSQSATELVAKIDTYEKTIDEKKLALAAQQPIAQAPTPFNLPTPVPTALTVNTTPAPQATTVITQPTPMPQPAAVVSASNQQTIEDLDKTKKDLEKIKNELKKDVPENKDNQNKGHNDNSH